MPLAILFNNAAEKKLVIFQGLQICILSTNVTPNLHHIVSHKFEIWATAQTKSTGYNVMQVRFELRDLS